MPMRPVMATDADLGDDLVEVLDVLGDPRGHRPGLRQLLSAVPCCESSTRNAASAASVSPTG
jgi:hypothetical protein